MAVTYQQFLETKKLRRHAAGFKPTFMPDFLKDFQKFLVDWAVTQGRGAIYAECGVGKGPMGLVFAENVLRHVPKSKVLIVTPLAVAEQFIRESKKFSLSEVKKTKDGHSYNGINVTNYESLAKFNPNDFAGIVADECFPPLTKVDVINIDNTLSVRYIKDIRPGDKIINASGVDHVEACFKRRINGACVLKIRGRKITCSKNHKFFTTYGWKAACDIRTGDHILETTSAMLLMQDSIFSKTPITQKNEILRNILLSEMENAARESQISGLFKREEFEFIQSHKKMVSRRKRFCGKGKKKNSLTKSYVQSKAYKENDGDKKEKWHSSQMAHNKRGEWNRADGSRKDFNQCTGIRVVPSSSSFESIAWVSKSLQNRLRKQKIESRNRSGRPFSQDKKTHRRKERQKISFARVDHIEILEQGHPELEKYRDAEGSLYFYDIKASRHPSFSVNGLLVHNSSRIKHFDSKTRKLVTSFFEKIPYRLLCTATPAPNDFMELGTSAEALGVMTRNQMLSMFFTNDGKTTQQWQLKGHAKKRFWQWMGTWARAMKKPSDFGFDDTEFILPKLHLHQHVLPTKDRDGFFPRVAVTLDDQRRECRNSIEERCKFAASLVPKNRPCILWCNMNPEGILLNKLIPDSVEVAGCHSDEIKEERLNGFCTGKYRVLVTKAKIAGFGLNMQNCADVVYFPSWSHEAYYQAIRRCWRFGQKREVHCHLVFTEALRMVVDGMVRKERQAEEMYSGIVRNMHEVLNVKEQNGHVKMELPLWLNSQ